MEGFIVLATLALVAKVWLVIKCLDKLWIDTAWISLILTFSVLNASEVLIYSSSMLQLLPNALLKVYYLCTVICLVTSYNYVADSSIQLQKWLGRVLYMAAVVISFFIATTDLVIGAHVVDSFPIKTIKGDYFLIYLLYAVVCIVGSLTILCVNYRSTKNSHEKMSYAYTIIAFMPLALMIVAVLFLINVGINANASGLIPVGTSIFLWVSYKGKVSSNIILDPRGIINPLGSAAKSQRNVMKAQSQLMLGNATYAETIAIIETAIVDSLIAEHDGNISKASRESGVDRAMIYRKRSKV